MSAGIAGYPTERFPRLFRDAAATPAQRDALVTEAPPESSYDEVEDAEYIRTVIESGTTINGVFGITIHWFQVNDSVRRLQAYLKTKNSAASQVFTSAFPNLEYVWLKRRDKVAQAVSWYKAIETGLYVKECDAKNPSPTASQVLKYDYLRIKRYWSVLRSWDNAWKHYFVSSNLKPLIVYYEELVEDYDAAIKKVLEFLRIDHQGVYIGRPLYEKISDSQSTEWIRKFKMLHPTR